MVNKNIQKKQKAKLFDLPTSRKGQGLSINMIILVAIALLVLVIIAILISRSGRDFNTSTKCIKKGGICRTTCLDGEGEIPISIGELCGDTGAQCCQIIG